MRLFQNLQPVLSGITLADFPPCALSVALILPMVLPFFSLAQPATANPLETVTVVATRNEVALDALPESVSVVNAGEIRDDQASNIAEVLANLAGVDTAGGPRAGAQSVVIRGIGGSRVLYTIDGSRQSFEGGHRGRFVLDPGLIKRVDMLRGPASAQYGSGAIGGVLAVHTRNVEDLLHREQAFGAMLRSGYESAGSLKTHSVIGFGQLGRVGLIGQRSYQHNTDYRDGSSERIQHTADELHSQLLKMSLDLGEHNSLNLLHMQTHQLNLTPSNPAQPIADSNPLLDKDNDTRNASLAWRFRPATEYFSGLDLNLYQNQTNITEDRVDEPRHDEIAFQTHGANLSLIMQADENHRWLTGFDVHRDNSDASRNGQPRPQFPDAEQTMRGAFLQYQADFGSTVSVISAVRRDHFESRSNTATAGDVEESETTARLGASVFAADWLTLHANYTEAYRAPNLLENYAAGIHFLGNEFQPNPTLKPELAANKEMGFVVSSQNDTTDIQWRVRGNLYRNDIENFIETLVEVEENMMNLSCLGPFPPPGCVFGTISIEGSTTAVNLPAARIEGWELEGSYRNASLLAELAWGRSRGTSLDDERPLLNIPADAVKLHLLWEGQQWALGSRINRYSAQRRVPPADLNGGAVNRSSGYTVIDLYARWQPHVRWARDFTLNAGIDNVTDRSYRSHLSTLNSPGRSLRVGFSYQI